MSTFFFANQHLTQNTTINTFRSTAEDVNDMPTSKQEPASCAAPNSDKVCPSPCSSASPSPSPSAMKSSGESATMTSSSGDECEGAPCPRNGIGDSTLHGVLTPPNDGESQCGSGVVDDGSKQFRYNGRLEFYKGKLPSS